MVGRVGHYEDVINGTYERSKKEDKKKDDVRLFYEKSDKDGGDKLPTVLCYGSNAWSEAESTKTDAAGKPKPVKGWMIGWWQDLQPHEVEEGCAARRLFIAARCQMGDANAASFTWEVRDPEGEFVSDKETQLVLLPAEEKPLPSPTKQTIRLADDAGLRPDKKIDLSEQLAAAAVINPLMSPMAGPGSPIAGSPYGMFPGIPAGSPLAGLAQSPFAFLAPQLFPQPPAPAGEGKGKKKKKKNKKGEVAGAYPAGGLRADAPEFVPGGSPMAAGLPPGFPGAFGMPFGMPGGAFGMRPPFLAPQVSINSNYMTPDEAAQPLPPAPKTPASPKKKEQAAKAPPPSPKKDKKPVTHQDGVVAKTTSVEWTLVKVTDKLAACKQGEAVKSSSFQFTQAGITGPPMTLNYYPLGEKTSPSGCVVVELECLQGKQARLKFNVFAGQPGGARKKVLMGTRMSLNFDAVSVFNSEQVASPNYDGIKVGIELIEWMPGAESFA